MAGGVEAGDAVDDGGERGALVLLDEAPVADVLEPPVGDVGRDLLHGIEAEVAAVGEDRGEQHADFSGVDLLAGLLEVAAEPEVVLDLDEQVGEPDGAAAGVQPAVQLGEAVGLRRVGLLGRVRLHPPPVVVERDLPIVGNTFQEAVERVREPLLQALDRRSGVDGESGTRPEPSRTCSHWSAGRKKASKRPKLFASSMARLPVLVSSRTWRNNARSPSVDGRSRRRGG